jgi:heat shock protein HtpX
MGIFKRIFLFLAINLVVILTISAVLKIFNIQPYLTERGLNPQALLVFCLIWGMGGALISLSLSRVMAKWFMGVKIIDPHTTDPELRKLLSTVAALSEKAELPSVPEVGIYESPEVNAFATGPTKRRSLVAVSRGLLSKMNQNELEGVLAHELSHISNGDMVTMTLIQGVVNAFVMFLARALAFVLSGLGRGNQQRENGGSYGTYMILVFVFEILFMVLGSLLVFWFSRQREFRADKGGAAVAGKSKMIAALESLATLTKRYVDPKAAQPAFQTMKISTPSKHGLALLFASHPPIEVRIQRLKEEN